MDIAEKISHSGKLTTCTEPEFRDIDSDQKDPQLCSIYAIDIYRNLRVAEVCTTTRTLVILTHIFMLIFAVIPFLQLMRRPHSTFMETGQRDITQSMRGILVDWLVEVCVVFDMQVSVRRHQVALRVTISF